MGLSILVLALSGSAASAASAQRALQSHPQRSARTCSTERPRDVSFRRLNGRTFGVLRWRPGPDAPPNSRYWVLRNGAVVGATRGYWMRVNVAFGRRYRLRVRLVLPNGQRLICARPLLRVINAYRLPSAPRFLSITNASGGAVMLSWERSTRGDAALAGYRVLRDSAVYRQTRATSMTIPVASNRDYTFTVLAVDAEGHSSAPSNPVRVMTGHTAPSAPASLLGAALNDTTVQLTWRPSVAAQGRIVGYRVLRDGAVVGQFAQTTVTLGNMAPSTTYTFTVVAVDGYGALSPPATGVSVTTANPIPTNGHVYAFVLADTGQSFQDFQAHYQEIGTVSPTYYDCSGSGQITGGNVPLITGWAQARQVKVLPRFNCQNGAVIDNILNDQALRQQWLTGIMNEVNANGYDGVMMDFEAGYPQDRDAYTAFVTDLAAELHAESKMLAIAVSAKTADVPNHPRSTFFDYNGLSAQADALFVLCWGVHWATSAPGAQDDMTWERQVVAYISTLPRVSKFILGMQLYAMDWPNGGGSGSPATAMEYQDVINLAASEGVTPTRDSTADAWTFTYTDASGVNHTVWFTDSSTEADRISLAVQSGLGGVGVWRLGREDQRLWANPDLTSAWP
jgi:spore germination protein YaaH